MDAIPREICRNMDQALAHEWLIGNGAGSYAAGTIAGALTRREHGLLVVPTGESTNSVLLAKMDEEIEVEGQQYKLGTNIYSGNIVSPDGFLYLQQVTFDGVMPTFWYEAGRFQLTKSIWIEPGHPTTYIRYTLAETSIPARLTLVPFCDFRLNDRVTKGNSDWRFPLKVLPNGFKVSANEGAPAYSILTKPVATFTPLELWYWSFELRADGNTVTDLYVPGLLRAQLIPGGSLTVIATTQEPEAVDFDIAHALEAARAHSVSLPLPPPNSFTSDVFRQPNL